MRPALRWLPWLLAALAWLPAAAQPPLRVAVVATDFVLPERTARLDALGAAQGVAFEHVRADAGPATADRLAAMDLLLLDTPRPSDVAQVQAALGPLLERPGLRWVRVGGGPPAGGGLPGEDVARIAGYYAGGGEANHRHLLQYLDARLRGRDAAAIPPPVPMPTTGYHHPDADRSFADASDYAAWRDGRVASKSMPSAAIVVSPGAVASLQTAVLDAVIARAAAHGVHAFGVWFDDARPDGLQQALAGLDVDAIVVMTHLQGAALRRAEFEVLDVPVLQALTWRQGDAAQWRAAASGLAPPLVPTFLAVPEGWGAADPLVVAAVADGVQTPIPEQVGLLATRLARTAALRRTPAADKRIATLFWNYPAGERNLSASHLNVPRSLERLLVSLDAAGYRTQRVNEAALIADAQRMLAGLYRSGTLDALHADGLAAAVPMAVYRRWFEALPEARRAEVLAAHGAPEDSPAARRIAGESVLLVPRLLLGNVALLPQPPRGARPGEAAHDLRAVPDHRYLATYLFVRETFDADALLHFGTHGTQEWLPGKDRGLWAHDWPMATVGEVPVFYPYIQDNVGEAVQAKRRGRAVIVSHQTPPFAPAGLYDELRDLHALVHELQQLDAGGVRDRTALRLVDAAFDAGIAGDLGWDRDGALADFDAFAQALHDHLHDLARSTLPLGLHVFGQAADPAHRTSTVMQQLSAPYYRALGLDADELFADDAAALQDNPAWRWLHARLADPDAAAGTDDPALLGFLEQARASAGRLADPQETEALLHGLAGGFVLPGAGGDPVRDPSLRSGRNLYPFQPDRIPTRAAYAAGGEALAQLVAAYRADHDGQAPRKLAFSLWSSEAMRQLGVLEAQALHALGLRPVWDGAGRVTALEIVPDAELERPRIDVVLQVTSVYRDQFDGFMRLLADAIDRLAAEGDHAIADNVRARTRALVDQGVDPARARTLAALRIFGNAPGEYGSGLTARILDDAPDADKDDAALAQTFLSRLQYAYGARDWGVALDGGNLFAEQLRGVDAAVLSRSSNTHGLLSTDHPFEYLGGLSAAVRHLDGRSPALYVSDLRGGAPRTAQAARFLAGELRSRQLNPQWIRAMQAEGYAGTLQVLDTVNNLFGWQVADPAMVRDAQWQAIHDTYVRDVRALGIDAWFERDNPTAQAQLIRRMREAIDRGLWQATPEVRETLDARLRALDALEAARDRADASPASAAPGAPGFGIAIPSPAAPPAAASAAPSPAPPGAATTDVAPAATPPAIRGRVMREVPTTPTDATPAAPGVAWLTVLALCLLAGAWRQRRDQRLLPMESAPR
ncbi:cobaltochelatase subunit CobN [Luteimonas sp. FCS-9]|uniref:cobaltochelatase subunit CobN n=1 Tax=Luteimonas sp. FCS-9 TaxID=1547516 RepID=UPI00063EB3A8|nr:cobaltochelatase subunit CobN [Luteimonas sp. FCS-9]KLI98003.1 cobalamin biosynthesis protein CobN [Luteimonas sp. FCS-9]